MSLSFIKIINFNQKCCMKLEWDVRKVEHFYKLFLSRYGKLRIGVMFTPNIRIHIHIWNPYLLVWAFVCFLFIFSLLVGHHLSHSNNSQKANRYVPLAQIPTFHRSNVSMDALSMSIAHGIIIALKKVKM